jgi:hypothetical protein
MGSGNWVSLAPDAIKLWDRMFSKSLASLPRCFFVADVYRGSNGTYFKYKIEALQATIA